MNFPSADSSSISDLAVVLCCDSDDNSERSPRRRRRIETERISTKTKHCLFHGAVWWCATTKNLIRKYNRAVRHHESWHEREREHFLTFTS